MWYTLENSTVGCGVGDEPPCDSGIPPQPDFQRPRSARRVAYAESTDNGATFSTPNLHQYSLFGSKDNNIIGDMGIVGRDPAHYNRTAFNSVFIDPNEPQVPTNALRVRLPFRTVLAEHLTRAM